jgi:peptidoglycan/LPS O-acetylase OafA/YrhL
VFFVISGYLITLLLIGEDEKNGHVDLRQFWLRRARRLLPALFVTLALLMVFCALFNRDQLGNIRGDVVAGLAYGSNWYQIWVGQGYTSQLDFVPLRHLWSLAVEEQFYLIWPLVMVGVLRLGRRRLPEVAMWLTAAAVVVAIAVGLLFAPGIPGEATNLSWMIGDRAISKNDALYLATFSRAGGLLLGAAFAMLWRPRAVMRGPLRDRGGLLDLVALVGLGGLVGMSWVLHVTYENGAGDPWLFRGGFFLVAVCTIMVMAAVTHQGAYAGKLLGTPTLVWIGVRSYGLYLFHWPIYQIIREQSGARLSPREFVLAMVITIAITEASYRFVETPVRKQRLGRWWRRVRDRADVPTQAILGVSAAVVLGLVGFGAFGVATGDLKANDVDEIIERGSEAAASDEEVLAALGSTTVPAVSVAPTAAGTAPAATAAVDPNAATTVAPVAAATTVAAAPGTGPMIAIGDSVMLGATNELQGIGFAQVAANEGRQFAADVQLAQQVGASPTPPSVVLVHLGYNGNISQSDADAFFGALQNVPLVMVMTVWGPTSSWVAPNNQLIESLPSRFGNVRVMPWAAEAPNCDAWAQEQGYQNPCFAASDGYHLGGNGAEFYALKVQAWLNQYKAELGLP